MSVIAFDGRIVAADQAVFNCGLVDLVHKVIYTVDSMERPVLVASVGSWPAILEIREWLRLGMSNADFPASARNPDQDSEHLVIYVGRDAHKSPYLHMQSHVPYYEFSTPYVAGERNARAAVLGAMLTGMNAADAVSLVVESKRFDAVGYGVDAYDVLSGEKIR